MTMLMVMAMLLVWEFAVVRCAIPPSSSKIYYCSCVVFLMSILLFLSKTRVESTSIPGNRDPCSSKAVRRNTLRTPLTFSGI